MRLGGAGSTCWFVFDGTGSGLSILILAGSSRVCT